MTWCFEEQRCHQKFEPPLWFGITFWFAYHFAIFEVCAYFDQVCTISQHICLWRFTNYCLYNDPYNKFDDHVFYELKVFETFTNKNLLMSWCVDLNGEEANCLVIEFFGLNILWTSVVLWEGMSNLCWS